MIVSVTSSRPYLLKPHLERLQAGALRAFKACRDIPLDSMSYKRALDVQNKVIIAAKLCLEAMLEHSPATHPLSTLLKCTDLRPADAFLYYELQRAALTVDSFFRRVSHLDALTKAQIYKVTVYHLFPLLREKTAEGESVQINYTADDIRVMTLALFICRLGRSRKEP